MLLKWSKWSHLITITKSVHFKEVNYLLWLTHWQVVELEFETRTIRHLSPCPIVWSTLGCPLLPSGSALLPQSSFLQLFKVSSSNWSLYGLISMEDFAFLCSAVCWLGLSDHSVSHLSSWGLLCFCGIGEVSNDLQVERLIFHMKINVEPHFLLHRNVLYNMISLNRPQEAVSWGRCLMAIVL